MYTFLDFLRQGRYRLRPIKRTRPSVETPQGLVDWRFASFSARGATVGVLQEGRVLLSGRFIFWCQGAGVVGVAGGRWAWLTWLRLRGPRATSCGASGGGARGTTRRRRDSAASPGASGAPDRRRDGAASACGTPDPTSCGS